MKLGKRQEKMIAQNPFGTVMVNVNPKNLKNMQVIARGIYIREEHLFVGNNGYKYYVYADGSAVAL